MEESEVIADLHPTGILSYIDPENLEVLKFHGEFGEYGPGEVLVQEGIRQYHLYIVIAGCCEVLVGSGDQEVLLGEIGPGDCVGEVSILEPGEATATVRVRETSVLWKLDVEQLQRYFEKLPVAGGQLMLGIAQLLCKRLRSANQTILTNKLTPKHLSIRSGRMVEPIRAENVAKEEKGGLFAGLLGKKEQKPKISTAIKK
ncbi:MAG: Crp/Fnr family transcriptional regulator [Candidatus Methylacidiphilales bacterium]